MKARILVAFVAVLLAACGGAPAPSVDQAMATIGAGLPDGTSAPAVVSLASIDLEPLLIQTGDLPAGISGAQVRDAAPKMFDGMSKATKVAYQQLASGDKQIGGVAVFLYESNADRDAGYAFVAKGMGKTKNVANIGEQAIETMPDAHMVELGLGFDLLFQRCHAIAHIRINGEDPDAATAYAKRLDKRLAAVVC